MFLPGALTIHNKAIAASSRKISIRWQALLGGMQFPLAMTLRRVAHCTRLRAGMTL